MKQPIVWIRRGRPGHPGLRARRAAALAFLLAFPRLLLPCLAAPGPGARLEGGPFLPWKINAGTLVSEEGLAGRVRLLARDWEGRETPVFEARDLAWTKRLDLAFWLDEDARSLVVVEGEGKDERRTLEVDLAAEAAAAGPLADGQKSGRADLRSLAPPLVAAGSGGLPARWDLPAGDPGTVAIAALGALLREEAPALPMAILAAFALAAAALAALAGKVRQPESPDARRSGAESGQGPSKDTGSRGMPLSTFGILGLLVVLATAGTVLALPRRASLLVVSVPVSATGLPRTALAAPLAGRPGGSEACSITRYAPLDWPAGAARWDLVSFSAPAGGLPLSALGLGAGAEARACRFSEPPLVVASGDGFSLACKGRVTGWIIDEGD